MKTFPSPLPALACLIGFLHPCQGQINYREDGRIVGAQRSLPSTGPGSAWFNPAALGETRLVHGQIGIFFSPSSRTRQDFADLSATLPPHLAPWLPVGLSMGFSRFSEGTSIENSTVIYVESAFVPSLALTFPSAPEAPYHLAAGVAFPSRTFDVFGAVQSTSRAMDLGVLGKFDGKGMGRFRWGFTFHGLGNPEVDLPPGRGYYAIPGWRSTSLGYATPSGGIRFHAEYFFEENATATVGPGNEGSSWGLNALEVELKPVAWMGIKAEVTRVAQSSSFGTVFYPQYGAWPARFYLEANIGHDRLDVHGLGWLLGPPQDEGRGFLFGLSLGGGI